MPRRKTTTITVRLPENMRQRLRELADDAGESEAVILREALRDYFDRKTSKVAEDVAKYRAKEVEGEEGEQ